jgi:hypothetical protein
MEMKRLVKNKNIEYYAAIGTHLQAHLGGLDSRHITAWAAPNNDDIIFGLRKEKRRRRRVSSVSFLSTWRTFFILTYGSRKGSN